jgi:hypothetical protein
MSPRNWPMTRTAAAGFRKITSLRIKAYSAPETRKAQANMCRQSRNVPWNQRGGGTLTKMTIMTRTGFAEPSLFDLGISLIPLMLTSHLANITQPTSPKARENTTFLTPTTQNAFLFRINNIPGMCGLGRKLECPLESAKRGLHARKNQQRRQSGNVLWNQRHDSNSRNARAPIRRAMRTGMSFRINKTGDHRQTSKRRSYLAATSAMETLLQAPGSPVPPALDAAVSCHSLSLATRHSIITFRLPLPGKMPQAPKLKLRTFYG